MAAVTCICGRICKSRSGFATHTRTCEQEKARSAAVLARVEAESTAKMRADGTIVGMGAIASDLGITAAEVVQIAADLGIYLREGDMDPAQRNVSRADAQRIRDAYTR